MSGIKDIIFSLDHIHEAAAQCWQTARQYRCIAFSGGLGAGKTTFIHALCDHIGVKDAVSSPTFSLINEYHYEQDGTDCIIYHMDWYRLRDTEEAINAGMEDCLMQPGAQCFVEWPEQAPELLPSPCLWISLQHAGDDQRIMQLEVK